MHGPCGHPVSFCYSVFATRLLTTEVYLAATRITKAVIAAAGSGTRFLPATKAIPKEMIPLIDRPIIQYLVEELAASGIEDVVFVSRWDKKVLEDHFDQHPTLEDSLAASGKERHLEETRRPANWSTSPTFASEVRTAMARPPSMPRHSLATNPSSMPSATTW